MNLDRLRLDNFWTLGMKNFASAIYSKDRSGSTHWHNSFSEYLCQGVCIPSTDTHIIRKYRIFLVSVLQPWHTLLFPKSLHKVYGALKFKRKAAVHLEAKYMVVMKRKAYLKVETVPKRET